MRMVVKKPKVSSIWDKAEKEDYLALEKLARELFSFSSWDYGPTIDWTSSVSLIPYMITSDILKYL